jgi:Ras-related protein Rab-23
MLYSKKIIVIGPPGSGKSSMVNQFLKLGFDKIPAEKSVRIERKNLELTDMEMQLIIWDVPGESHADLIPFSYLLGCTGVVYVVDANNPMSFMNMSSDLQFIKNKLPDLPMMIVGNKADLLQEAEINQVKAMMPVSPHFMASAKENRYIDGIFEILAEQIFSASTSLDELLD